MAQLSAFKKFAYKKKEKIVTGIDPLDTVLNNGLEQGDLICLASKPGGGKSTLFLQLAKVYIEDYGKKVAYLDAERGVKEEILVNMDLMKYVESGQLFLSNMISTYGDASEVIDEILASPEGEFGLLIIDSITQLVPAKMLSVDVESNQVALKAKAMTAFVDKYRGQLANKNIITCVVAQYRKNLMQTYPGASEYNISAPMCMQYAADVILHITTSAAKDRKIFAQASVANGSTETSVGATHYLWAEKNKHAIPFIKVNFPVIYGVEVSNIEYLRRLIEDKELYVKSGSWYSEIAGLPCRFQGKENIFTFVEEHYEELRTKLLEDGHYDLVNFEKMDPNENALGVTEYED